MKNKFIQTVLPFCVFPLLLVISILSPAYGENNGWIPLVGGFFNADLLDNLLISVPSMIICLAVILLGIYRILLKTNAIPFSRCLMLFLMLMASNPHLLKFSQIYPVLACVVWTQLCLLEGRLFVSFLLLSTASLFYAPAIWLVPAVLFIMPFNGVSDQFRAFVTSISAVCLPHLYLIVFRWIKFDDASIYLHHFAQEAIDISIPFHYIGITDYFLLLVVIYIIFRSISHFITKGTKGFIEYMFKMNVFMVLITSALFLLFAGNHQMQLLSLTFVPLSILFTHYFKSCEKSYRANIEYLVFMCSLILCALSGLMN